MKTYKTKSVTVLAEPMTLLAYYQLMDYERLDDEGRVGYLVQIPGRRANTEHFPHWVHWIEKEAFEKEHEETKPDNYFTRLLEEKNQNKERLDKLSLFLDQQGKLAKPTVAYEPLRLLFLQQTLMSELEKVLAERIRLAELEMEK